MNLQKLKNAEAYFLELYPEGFEDAGLLPIIKKHHTAKISDEVRELFSKENFTQPDVICEHFAKIVSKIDPDFTFWKTQSTWDDADNANGAKRYVFHRFVRDALR